MNASRLHPTDEFLPKQNLFAMLRPDACAREQLERLARSCCATYGLLGRPFALDRFHLSLCSFGDVGTVSPRLIRTAEEVCDQIADGTRPFEVQVDQLMSFSGREDNKPLVMCSGRRNRTLEQVFHDFFPWIPETEIGRIFNPHVTLLYDPRSIAKRCVESVSWVAKEIVLVISHVGKSLYTEVGSFLFRG